VIVRVGEYLEVSCYERPKQFDPIGQSSPRSTTVCPCLCYFFDSLAVAQPAHVSEVRSNQVKLFLHLPRPGTNDVSVSAKATLCSRSTSANLHQATFVSNLDYKCVVCRQLLQEGISTARKLSCFGISSGRRTEIERPSGQALDREYPSFLQLFEFRIAIHQHLLMCNRLWNLRGENKIRRVFSYHFATVAAEGVP